MISDAAITNLVLAQSANSVDAQLLATKVRLQVQQAAVEANSAGADTGTASDHAAAESAVLDVLQADAEIAPPHAAHVDKRA